MARRFLTVEDLHRLCEKGGTREIAVEEGTVVTPQALEEAARMGVAIRTGSAAAYTEPAPDRGPDAEVARRTLPHLPEPADESLGQGHGVVVTAVGKNRPGVLAEITGALAHIQANVLDISQKMIEGYFHMVVTVELPPGASFGEIKTKLECLGGPDDYVVRVMHERVFRFMHRI
jgi:ACT domain-containing protein